MLFSKSRFSDVLKNTVLEHFRCLKAPIHKKEFAFVIAIPLEKCGAFFKCPTLCVGGGEAANGILKFYFE